MKISQSKQEYLNDRLIKVNHQTPFAAEEIEKLLDAGADVNSIGLDEESMLIRMSRNGNLAAVELLIDRGADLLKTDSTGRLALHFAANLGHASVVDNDGWSALHFAASNGKLTVIEVLLKHIPIAQHLEMYQEALGMAKERNKIHCIAFIEQALLQHAMMG